MNLCCHFTQFQKNAQSTILILFFLFGLTSTGITQNNIGIFDMAVDVGPVLHQGSTKYDDISDTYELAGAGSNIWFDKDEFHFAYKKLSGDFILKTKAHLVGEGVDPHRKFGWMVRAGLDTSAAMITAAVHGDGLTAIQFRKRAGENIEEVKSIMVMPEVIHLERRGRSFFMTIAKVGEPYWTVEIPDLDFPEELYVGIFICSHNANVVEHAKFQEVEIINEVIETSEP